MFYIIHYVSQFQDRLLSICILYYCINVGAIRLLVLILKMKILSFLFLFYQNFYSNLYSLISLLSVLKCWHIYLNPNLSGIAIITRFKIKKNQIDSNVNRRVAPLRAESGDQINWISNGMPGNFDGIPRRKIGLNFESITILLYFIHFCVWSEFRVYLLTKYILSLPVHLKEIVVLIKLVFNNLSCMTWLFATYCSLSKIRHLGPVSSIR